eukprot:gene4044-3245_t
MAEPLPHDGAMAAAADPPLTAAAAPKHLQGSAETSNSFPGKDGLGFGFPMDHKSRIQLDQCRCLAVPGGAEMAAAVGIAMGDAADDGPAAAPAQAGGGAFMKGAATRPRAHGRAPACPLT